MEQLHILIHLTDSEKYAKPGISLCREKMVLLPHKCLVGRAFFSFLGLKLFFRSLKHVVIRMGSSEIPCDVEIYQMVLCNMQSSVCRPKSAKEGSASLIWVETVHLNEHTCIVKSIMFFTLGGIKKSIRDIITGIHTEIECQEIKLCQKK